MPAYRIVLDTNVLVSGLLSEQGTPGRIFDLLLSGDLLLLHDPRILAEYSEVIGRPELAIDRGHGREILRFLAESGESIDAPPWPRALPDPDDEPFLAVAHAGNSLALVTGNPRHYPAAVRGGVRIWSPRELVDWLRQATPQAEGP